MIYLKILLVKNDMHELRKNTLKLIYISMIHAKNLKRKKETERIPEKVRRNKEDMKWGKLEGGAYMWVE
jgi:hypothetical protein